MYPNITEEDEKELYLKGPQCSSIEGQIVRIVDKIASGIHDVEDALRLGLISMREIRKLPLFENILLELEPKYKSSVIADQFKRSAIEWPGFEDDTKVREACIQLRIFLVNKLIEETSSRLINLKIDNVKEFYKQRKNIAKEEIVTLKEEDKDNFRNLKDKIDSKIINSDLINEADAIAERVIEKLYTNYSKRPLLLPKYILSRYEWNVKDHVSSEHQNKGRLTKHEKKVGKHQHFNKFNQAMLRKGKVDSVIEKLKRDPIFCRMIVDYIAGMTDRFALEKAQSFY